MKKEDAIKKLESKLQNDYPSSWKYAGDDYQDEVLGAASALNSLVGLDSYMTEEEAIQFAENLK